MKNPIGLFSVDGNQFCGPTAIAAITGVSAAVVEAAVVAHRKVEPAPRGDRNMRGQLVKSMWSQEVWPVCKRLGWNALQWSLDDKPTFATWIKTMPAGPCLVLITGHFVAVNGSTFVDTLTGRKPIPLKSVPTRIKRARVIRVWQLSKIETPAPLPAPVVTPAPQPVPIVTQEQTDVSKTMSKTAFVQALHALGYTTRPKQSELLGIHERSVIRYANGQQEVPEYVRRLLVTFQKLGIPKEFA